MNVRRGKRTRGVGLVEVLVTVVLLSIGFLAAARMQVEGMRSSREAYHRSQAHLVASDMVDRMRANSAGVRLGFYDGRSTLTAPAGGGCDTSGCTPQSLAAQDFTDWRGYLVAPDGVAAFVPVLPSSAKVAARGEVVALGDNRYAVRVTWSERVAGEDVARQLELDVSL